MNQVDYHQIYNDLYGVGYLAGNRNGGKNLVTYLCQNYQFDSILDIGCSQGAAVQKYQIGFKKEAYGVDVSQIAIENSKKLDIQKCIHGSILDLPFEDKRFDAIVSSDTLEHLDPLDVKLGIQELIRVSKVYLFLKIATRAEGERQWLKAIQEKDKRYKDIDNLHLSIFSQEKWIELIEKSKDFQLAHKHKDLLIFRGK